MTTRTPEAKCLRCEHKVDAVSHPTNDEVVPKPGDATVCLYCGYLMVFTDDMTFRELTEEELLEVPLDELSQLQRARKVVMDRLSIEKPVKK